MHVRRNLVASNALPSTRPGDFEIESSECERREQFVLSETIWADISMANASVFHAVVVTRTFLLYIDYNNRHRSRYICADFAFL